MLFRLNTVTQNNSLEQLSCQCFLVKLPHAKVILIIHVLSKARHVHTSLNATFNRPISINVMQVL